MLRKFTLVLAVVFSISSAHATTGGPDSFGYTFIDSYEAGGPTFSWIEIAPGAGGSGTIVPGATDSDDAHDFTMVLSFPFPFYGSTYTNLAIGSNGTIYFEDVYLGLSNSCVPGTPTYTMTDYRFIAHLWDDLNPGSGGDIYFQDFGTYAVIEYYQVHPYGSTDPETWEVILYDDGTILMQYQEMGYWSTASDFTIGIQDSPTVGLEYTCDGTGPALSDGLAILWSNAPALPECIGAGFDFGSDMGCVGDTLFAATGTLSDLWSDGSTDTALVTTTAGVYYVTSETDSSCYVTDTITINDLPTVLGYAVDSTVCDGADLTLYGGGADTYTWSGGATDNVPFPATTATTTYIVTGTDAATGCSSQDDIDITVYDLPAVTWTEGTTLFCDDAGPYAFTEGSPAGGTFSGTGVTGIEFDPVAAGIGSHDVTYSYTDGNGCTGEAVVTFTVSDCAGLDENGNPLYTVYPNPTSDLINISGLKGGDVIEVYTMEGKLIVSSEATNNIEKIDFSSFESGVYLIKVNGIATQVQKH